MTRDDITAKVLRNLNDAGVVHFTADNVNQSIQDGYDDVSCYCGQLEYSKTISFQSNLSYYDLLTLIPDYYAVVAAYNYNSKRWLVDTSTQELDQIRWDWEIWTGNPIWFFPHNFRYIGVCPRLPIGTGSMEIFYKAQANVLKATDVPYIYSSSIKMLELYATGDLLESVKEYNKADAYLSQYYEIRERYKVDVKSLAMADRLMTIEQNAQRNLP